MKRLQESGGERKRCDAGGEPRTTFVTRSGNGLQPCLPTRSNVSGELYDLEIRRR